MASNGTYFVTGTTRLASRNDTVRTEEVAKCLVVTGIVGKSIRVPDTDPDGHVEKVLVAKKDSELRDERSHAVVELLNTKQTVKKTNEWRGGFLPLATLRTSKNSVEPGLTSVDLPPYLMYAGKNYIFSLVK